MVACSSCNCGHDAVIVLLQFLILWEIKDKYGCCDTVANTSKP